MSNFDPYHKWLGIPPEDQPADHYRLLGLKRFESDPEVIEAAADQRMAFLQRVATGEYTVASQELLNEIAAARLCLLAKKAKLRYDAAIRQQATATAGPPKELPNNAVPQSFACGKNSSDSSASEPALVPPKPPSRSPRNAGQPCQPPIPQGHSRWPTYVALVAIGAVALGATAIWLLTRGDPSPPARGLVRDKSEDYSRSERSRKQPDEDRETASAQGKSSHRQQNQTPSKESLFPSSSESTTPQTKTTKSAPSEQGNKAKTRSKNSGDKSEAGTLAQKKRTAAPKTTPPKRTLAENEIRIHARDILAAGFRGDMRAAQTSFEDIRKKYGLKPLACHALGLVLLKNGQNSEAERLFRTAADSKSSCCWRAQWAIVHLQLTRKTGRQLGDALKTLRATAIKLESSHSHSSEARNCAEWLGRVVAYLQIDGNPIAPTRRSIDSCDRTMKTTLTGPRLKSYEQGKVKLNADVLRMRQAKIASQSKQADTKSDKLKMSAAEWKKWLDGRIKSYDANLALLSSQFSVLAARAAAISRSVNSLNAELAAIEIKAGGVQRALQSTQYRLKTVQRNQLQSQYNTLDAQASLVRQRGMQILEQRQSDVNTYQVATGTIVRENTRLQKWKDALAAQSAKPIGKKRRKSAKSSPLARILNQQALAFDVHFKFDVNAEKDALLKVLTD